MASILKLLGAQSTPRGEAPPRNEHGDPHSESTPSGKTIRSGVAGRIPAGTSAKLAGFNLDDLVHTGQNQIEQTRVRIDEMLAEARLQAEAILIEAEARSHGDGLRRAEQEVAARVAREAESKAREQVQLLTRGVAAMRQSYNDWMRQYADVLTETALAAAERLTRSQLTLPSQRSGTVAPAVEAQEHLLVTWAREALHSTRSSTRLVLAVHPDTLAELGQHLDELLADPNLPEESTVMPDENLDVGDVVVRHDGGEILAGLADQLRRLREELS